MPRLLLAAVLAMFLIAPTHAASSGVDPSSTEELQPVIAYWTMNESSGTLVADVAGGHDGMSVGASTIVDAPIASMDKARDFGPRASYVEIPDHPAWDLDSEFTIEIWVYPRSVPASLFTHFNPEGNNRSISVDLDGTSLRLIVNSDGTSDGTDPNVANTPEGSVTLAEWQFLTATFNTGRFRLYRNGVLLSETTHPAIAVVPVSASILLGAIYADGPPPTPNFDGQMDEVRVLDVERQPSEVMARYLAFTAPEGVEEMDWSRFKATYR